MDGENKKRKSIVIQAYTLKELSVIYSMTKYLMRKALQKYKKQIGKRNGYYYETRQVELIFKLIRLPSNIELI